MKVSGFSRKNGNGDWSSSWLNVTSQGLGITGRSEGNGNNNQFLADNIGDSIDYMLFEFSTSIVPNHAFLNSINAGHSNMSAWIGWQPNPIANHLTLSDALLASLGPQLDNNTTSTASSRWAAFNATQTAGNVLVIAASVSDPVRDDAFKIHKLLFCRGGIPTPTPTPTPSPIATATPTPPQSPVPTPTPTPIPTGTPKRTEAPAAPSLPPAETPAGSNGLANISTRLFVQTGDNVMIGGFVIAGEVPKTVILRAIGPSLATFGIGEVMPYPALRLYDSTGVAIASNDNWRLDQSQDIEETGLAPSDDREAALVTTLTPGSYTAVVFDETNNTGVALFELYDLDPGRSRLVNLSTRGRVEAEDRVMIGGFMVGGDQPSKLMLRAIGPSLAELGVPDALVDPMLELRDGDGALVASNDDWRSEQEAEIVATTIPPANDRESAIVRTLLPGNYTVIVRGKNNSSGAGLMEIYSVN